MNMKTSDLLKKEICLISNKTLRDIVKEVLNAAPECIQIVPAFSSGKYHNQSDCAIGWRDAKGFICPGGLINHTRAATAIANSLMKSNAFKDIALGRNFEKYIDNADEKLQLYQDAALAACILHDCCKPDSTPQHKTQFDHPLLAANLFKKMAERYMSHNNKEYLESIIPLVYGSIASHMNKWNTSERMPDTILPLPEYGIEIFVSLCVYIASRNFIDFNFNIYDNKTRNYRERK